MYWLANIYAKLICENVAQTYYVISLFLSHNLWLSKFFRARIQRLLNLLDNSSLIKLSKDATSLGASCCIPRCLASSWITSKTLLFRGGTRIGTKFSIWIFGLRETS